MLALVVNSNAPGRMKIAETDDPTPRADQCLVKVEAMSLNHGELPSLTGAPDGVVPGWDAAGIVRQAAANGQGPAVGTRVLTFGWGGAWAELRAVDLDSLAVLPQDVDSGDASTLPVAAGTALRALRVPGSIVGRRVVVTGASGGVGGFAVQLAHQAGAYVTAVVGSEARGKGLAGLGADEVVVGMDEVEGPIFAAIENVGGAGLVKAYSQLESGGTIVSIGATSGEDSIFPPYSLVGPPRSIVSFVLGAGLGGDLEYLVGLLAARKLSSIVGWHGNWEGAAQASEALLGRRVRGKAVLTVD